MIYDYKANKALLIDSTGRLLTLALFEEYSDSRSLIKPLFRLEDWKEVYLRWADPTEYAPAMELIGNWEHWQAIRDTTTLKPVIDLWRQEVEIALRSKGVVHMLEHAKQPGGGASARWLAEAGFIEKSEVSGRKKKDKEQKMRAKVAEVIKSDAERLGLVVVKGGKAGG